MPDGLTGVALALAEDTGGGEAKKAGPLGLVVILLLCVASYFLFRSMSKHLKRVRDQFPGQRADPPAPTPPSSTGEGQSSAAVSTTAETPDPADGER